MKQYYEKVGDAFILVENSEIIYNFLEVSAQDLYDVRKDALQNIEVREIEKYIGQLLGGELTIKVKFSGKE